MRSGRVDTDQVDTGQIETGQIETGQIEARQIEAVRRFNRSYTQRIGALEDSFLGSGLPLGSARLLYEIGARPGSTQELRARLGLDSGYLSRLLRRLESDALVRVHTDPADRRRRLVSLTRRGRDGWERLEASSRDRAGALVQPLSPRQRDRLATALATADLLVRAATVELTAVAADSAVATAALGRYFAELQHRFTDGFDAAGQGAADPETLGGPDGTFVVAVSDGDAVACGGVYPVADDIAEVKRMWVDPDWRGAGLGSRLLRDLESRAAARGYRRVRLDTNDTLTEAIATYRRAGYTEIERYNDNPYARLWFEKHLG